MNSPERGAPADSGVPLAEPEVQAAIDGAGFTSAFSGRVAFGIRDGNGGLVGFGARRLSEEAFGPKYVNTRETAWFSKGRLLYGLDKAGAAEMDTVKMSFTTDRVIDHCIDKPDSADLRAETRAETERLARIEEIVRALELDGERTADNVPPKHLKINFKEFEWGIEYQRLRESPWCSALLGQCYGSSTWYSAMSDFVVMRKGAIMAIASPNVTSIAINKPIEAEDLGGWKLLTGVSGLADMAVDTDQQAMDAIKKFLSYLPSHHMQPPPEYPVPAGSDDACKAIFDILPESRNKVYDVRKILAVIADKDSCFELKERFGKSIATVLARIAGKSVGFIANNPMFKGSLGMYRGVILHSHRNVIRFGNAGAEAQVVDFGYDNAGRWQTTAYGPTAGSPVKTETRTYRANDNTVESIVVPGVTSFTYSYDANKRKTGETDGQVGAWTQTFGYDAEDRLTSWNRNGGTDTQSWVLSKVGDWSSTSAVLGGVTRNETRAHDPVHQLTGMTVNGGANQALSYDGKGNLTADATTPGGTQSYVWDVENRLARATKAGAPGITASYRYDALGRRTEKRVDNLETRYVHDGAREIAEYTSAWLKRIDVGSPSPASTLGAVDGTFTLTAGGGANAIGAGGSTASDTCAIAARQLSGNVAAFGAAAHPGHRRGRARGGGHAAGEHGGGRGDGGADHLQRGDPALQLPHHDRRGGDLGDGERGEPAGVRADQPHGGGHDPGAGLQQRDLLDDDRQQHVLQPERHPARGPVRDLGRGGDVHHRDLHPGRQPGHGHQRRQHPADAGRAGDRQALRPRQLHRPSGGAGRRRRHPVPLREPPLQHRRPDGHGRGGAGALPLRRLRRADGLRRQWHHRAQRLQLRHGAGLHRPAAGPGDRAVVLPGPLHGLEAGEVCGEGSPTIHRWNVNVFRLFYTK